MTPMVLGGVGGWIPVPLKMHILKKNLSDHSICQFIPQILLIQPTRTYLVHLTGSKIAYLFNLKRICSMDRQIV